MNASFIALPPILILSWISCPLSSPCRPMSPACKYSLQLPSCSNLLLFASRDCTVLCYAVLYCCARLHLRGQARRGHAPLHPRPGRAAAGGGAAGGRGQCRPLQPRTGRRGRGPTVRQPQGETVKISYCPYKIFPIRWPSSRSRAPPRLGRSCTASAAPPSRGSRWSWGATLPSSCLRCQRIFAKFKCHCKVQVITLSLERGPRGGGVGTDGGQVPQLRADLCYR